MKSSIRTIAGIRTSHFTNAVRFMTEVMNLEIILYEREEELAQFKLPSGQILEIHGTKNLWQPFTTPPDWEWIVAEIRYTESKD